jgi:addiction module HigA family antidote
MATQTKKLDALKKRKIRPTGPAELAAMLLDEQGVSQTEAARRLGISRVHLNRFLNDHVALTPDTANRLGRFFGNGPAFWLRLQHERELWDVLHSDSRAYADVEPLDKAA